jgi:O-antigen/teichoic acid export membrane protein
VTGSVQDPVPAKKPAAAGNGRGAGDETAAIRGFRAAPQGQALPPDGSFRRATAAPGGPPAGAQAAYGQPRGGHRRQRFSNPLVSLLTRAIRWIFMDAASARFGTLVIGLALARMMTPRDFGAFGVVVIALLGVQSVGQLGAGSVLALWRGSPGEIAPTVTAISIASSAAIYGACYAGAPAFAATLGAPAAAHVIRLVALNVLISGAVAAPRGMLQRRAPRLSVMVDQVDNWLGVLVTIALVTTGHGLISLAVGRIAGGLVAAIIFAAFSPRSLRVGFNRAEAGAVFQIALPFAASGALAFGITNVDQIVVGHVLHAPDLGFYLLALCCATWPATMFSQPVRDAAPVAFARFRRGPQVVGSAFMSSANLLASMTLPACLLISGAAGPLIQFVYGPAWAPAAHVLVWLAPLATLRVFYALANDYFAVLASSRRGLIFQLVWLVTLVPSLVAGAWTHGILGVVVVQVVIAVLFLVPWYLTELKPLAIWPRAPIARLSFPIGAAAAVGLVTVGARLLLRDDGVDLAIGGGAALAAMGLLGFRMRTVFTAVRRAAAGAGGGSGRVADIIGPALASAFVPVPALYPITPPLGPALRSAPTAASRDLGGKVRAGARWSIVNTVVLRVMNFAVGVVLARTVFGPSAWGLYAVSQIVLAVLLSANELGVSAAIIRWDGDVRDFARTVLTLSVLSSTVIYAGLFTAAPYVARLLGSPAATGMVRVVCVCVIIDGFAGVPIAMLDREFAQGRRMLVDALNFVVSTGVMLWLAFGHHGPISFAWGSVAGCTVALVTALVVAPHFILPGWDTAQARKLLGFGLPLAGAGLLMLGVVNVDSAIVGATLGPAMLGLYQLAFNVSSWPVTSISQAVARVSFAGFSRVADSTKALAEAFARAIGLVMAVTVPACVMLAVLAGPLIDLVYGKRWLPAAHALSLLAMLGLMRVAYQLMFDCMAAAGRRNTLMGVQGLWLAALVPVLLVGARLYGITGVSAGHIIVAAGLVGPSFLWALSRAGITVRSIMRVSLRPAVGGVLMAAASLLVLHYAGGGWLGLAGASVAGGVVYLPVVYSMRALIRSPLPSSAELTEADAT